MKSKKKKKDWFVYIVKCADSTLYTGITTDIDRRVHEHNNTKKGAKYTRTRRPVELVYESKYKDRSSATKEEIRIKKLKKKKKIALIEKE